jgi:hypothetical protein
MNKFFISSLILFASIANSSETLRIKVKAIDSYDYIDADEAKTALKNLQERGWIALDSDDEDPEFIPTEFSLDKDFKISQLPLTECLISFCIKISKEGILDIDAMQNDDEDGGKLKFQLLKDTNETFFSTPKGSPYLINFDSSGGQYFNYSVDMSIEVFNKP